MGIFFLILFASLSHISRSLLALGKNAKFCSEACKGLGPRPTGCARGPPQRASRPWEKALGPSARVKGRKSLGRLAGQGSLGSAPRLTAKPPILESRRGRGSLSNAVPFPTSHFPDGQAPRKRRGARARGQPWVGGQ